MRTKQMRQGLWIGLLLLVIAWLGSLIWGLAGKAAIAFSEERSTKVEYQSLEARRAALQNNLDTLSTARGQDAAIREAFGVAKPGEEVIVLVPTVPATTTPQLHWWQKLLGWF